MSHSKRNTSLAFFTSHERSLLKSHWGSQSTRLSRDSFLPFASCNLCLQPSISPVACATNGELFCRECIVSNLLSQRKEIKRLEKETQSRREREEEEQREKGREEGERAVKEFEKTMMGLEAPVNGRGAAGSKKKPPTATITTTTTNNTTSTSTATPAAAVDLDPTSNPNPNPLKRKHFTLDEPTMLLAAQHDRAQARRALDAESAAAKGVLPSFWVPSLTPSTGDDTRKLESAVVKLQPLCPGSGLGEGEGKHGLSLRGIVDVRFKTAAAEDVGKGKGDEVGGGGGAKYICPACDKTLSNSLKAVLAVPCGHVLCKPCAGKFMSGDVDGSADPHGDLGKAGGEKERREVRCYVCESDLTARRVKKAEKGAVRPEVVELRCEGTGFAGGGGNMVKAKGTAFQC